MWVTSSTSQLSRTPGKVGLLKPICFNRESHSNPFELSYFRTSHFRGVCSSGTGFSCITHGLSPPPRLLTRDTECGLELAHIHQLPVLPLSVVSRPFCSGPMASHGSFPGLGLLCTDAHALGSHITVSERSWSQRTGRCLFCHSPLTCPSYAGPVRGDRQDQSSRTVPSKPHQPCSSTFSSP